MNERIFEEMIPLQKSLRLSRILKVVSRCFFFVPLLIYLALWVLPEVWGYFIHMSHRDREGLWGYYLLLFSAGFAVVPLLLISLVTWMVFSLRCRRLKMRLSTLAASIR